MKPQFSSLDKTDAWVFDLDNTLYSAEIDLFSQIDARMRGFIARYLALDEDEAFRIQKRYFRKYGTTLNGMMTKHAMDPGPFLEHVHQIDLASLQINQALEKALARLPGRRIIFTNASKNHALRVTKRLGVDHLFDAVFDITSSGYIPKPDPAAYQKLVEFYDLDPEKTVMVEDMARNLIPAAALGMTTVWIPTNTTWGHESCEGEHIHHVADDLTEWLVAATSAY
jgi:putative hydrolase of the HAD superfamily